MDRRKYKAVDLDGTLAFQDGAIDPLKIGEPIPKMVDRVKIWIENGEEVVIFTARVSEGKDNRDINEVRQVIENWCEKNIGKKLPVTNKKDFGLETLWDDRAVRVKRNKGVIDNNYNDELDEVPEWVGDEIRETWNKARKAQGQLEAYRILEVMVDRLGYGRRKNNPSLA